MKILVICGSPRKQSLTRSLTDLACVHAKQRYGEGTVDVLDLGKTMVDPFCGSGEQYSQSAKDAVALVTGADVLIIGAPIYNGLISAALKNLFEHVHYKALEGRVAGFIIQAGGSLSSVQVQAQMTALMTYFRVLSNPRAVFTFTDEHFDEQGNLNDPGIAERIKRLVDETVALGKQG